MRQATLRKTANVEAFDVHARQAPATSRAKKPVVPAPAADEVHVVETLDEVRWLETEWRALEEQCNGAILFQSYDWCHNFVEHAQSRGTLEMRVITVSRGDRLVGLLPLAVRNDQGLKVLTGLTEPFQQYTEMLVAADADPRAVFRQMLPKLGESGADYLHLGQVREDGPLFAAIDGVVPASGEEDAAPYVPVADWPDFESYHRTVKAKTRKNMRNAKNRLERDAPLVHHSAWKGGLLADVIDRSFAGREVWLERQGLTSRAFRDSGFAEFVERFKHDELTGVPTIAFSLMHGDKPIADQWGFVQRGRYYAFIAGWDEAYEESSPGKLHLGAILESCFAEGFDVADFMIPAARYKFTWANDAVKVQDHVMALTLRGRLQNTIWLNFLRPLAKRAAYALPQGVRSALFKILLPVKE